MVEQSILRDKITFRYSPLLDMVLSLLVLQNPERFPHAGAWVDRVRERLPPGLAERLQSLGERLDLFAVVHELEEGSALPATEQLQQLAATEADLGGALLAYWEAVAPEVGARAGMLVESMQAEQARLASMDPLAFIARFSDRISVAGDGEAIILHWGKGMRVPVQDLREIRFVPSAFCPRRLMFYRLGPLQIFFYAPHRQEPAQVEEAPESLLLAFTALADETRLRLLRLVASEALPGQEMARRLGVNDSTVSRHLRLLVEAGLVFRERQEGKFIFYAFRPARLQELAAGTLAYLEGGRT